MNAAQLQPAPATVSVGAPPRREQEFPLHHGRALRIEIGGDIYATVRSAFGSTIAFAVPVAQRKCSVMRGRAVSFNTNTPMFTAWFGDMGVVLPGMAVAEGVAQFVGVSITPEDGEG